MSEWPAAVRATELALFVETLTGRFDAPLSAAAQVLTRPADPAGARLAAIVGIEGVLRQADRWAAVVTCDLEPADAATLDGFLAGVRGPAGTVDLPLWTARLAGSLASFDDHAAAVGETDWDADAWDDGTRFFEGAGTPRVRGGRGHRLTLDGVRPGASGVVRTGDLISGGTGRVYRVTADAKAADHNGFVTAWVGPTVRADTGTAALAIADTVAMRPQTDDSARNPTRAPARGRYTIELGEVV